jgi:cation:H+ antiporter
MSTLGHLSIFILSSLAVWLSAGVLIESVDRIAKRFHKTAFSVAFFVLGILTSLSEISVAINSSLEGVPQISVGNLVGASFVILLFIIPLLAIAGKGIGLKHLMSKRNIILAFAVILLPALLLADGSITKFEGVLAIIAFLILFYAIHSQKRSEKKIDIIPGIPPETEKATIADFLKIVAGGAIIFVAGHYLVEQSIFFAGLLNIPGSVIGLIILSIGTNVPELVIAARSIIKKHKDIAFGDYIGSAAVNTLIFGFLAFSNGSFSVEPNEFSAATMLMIVGLFFLYFFARSQDTVSRKEGFFLILFYLVFIMVQLMNAARLAAGV